MDEFINDWALNDDIKFTYHNGKRYICGVEVCSKSYSSRQNLHRHKTKDHLKIASNKSTTIRHHDVESNAMQSEQELLIESFSKYCEKCGEEETANAMKNNKKVKEHLIPIRKLLESEIADRTIDTKESQSVVQRQYIEFKNSLPNTANNEMAAFKAVIQLVRNATPESIGYLSQFAKLLTSMTTHMSNFSENVNPKYKISQILKNILDEMVNEVVDEFGIPSEPILSKRKAEETEGETIKNKKLKHAATDEEEVEFWKTILSSDEVNANREQEESWI